MNKRQSASINDLLEDLEKTEEMLKHEILKNKSEISIPGSAKSVSFGEIEEIDENKANTLGRHSQTHAPPILKQSSSSVVPSEVPLPPTEYNSDEFSSGDSDYSEDSLYNSEDEEAGADEDLEIGEEESKDSFFDPDDLDDTSSVFEQVTLDDFKSYHGDISRLDSFIKNRPPVINQKSGTEESRLPTVVIKSSPSANVPDDDSDDDTPIGLKHIPTMKTASSSSNHGDNTQALMAKLREANIRKTITSLMSSQDVVVEMNSGSDPGTWTLFELCSDLGIERPLRDWETVTDVLSAWGESTSNAVIMKKYGYKATLGLSYLRQTFPRIQGYLYLQLTPGSWKKRFCILKQYKLYYLSDQNNPNSETLLVDLSNYDIYTLIRKKKMPTEYGFAIRSDMNPSYFGNDARGYVHYVAVEKNERFVDWVLALRLAKSERMNQVANGVVSPPVMTPSPQSSNSHNTNSSTITSPTEPKFNPGSLLDSQQHKDKQREKKERERRHKSKDPDRKKKVRKPLIDFST